VDTDMRIDGNRDLATQTVERQALRQILRRARFAIDQQFACRTRPYYEIEQGLALGRQQTGIGGKGPGDIVRHETLEEGRDVLLRIVGRQADHGTVHQSSGSHG